MDIQIGINYKGQTNALRGCVNDAKRVREFLIKQGGYSSDNIVLLTDDVSDPRQLPTRKNIVSCMKWLVRGAEPSDGLFFHYSGHGGQTRDLDDDEIDGHDEVIFPLDFKKNGHITDDEMHELMVRPLPPQCRLTALFDACHSGTVLDLPYIYSSHGRLKGSHIKDKRRIDKSTQADVISWSGCKDGQTSADTFHGNVAVGAMSHAFVTSLTAKPQQSYQELLRSVRLILHPRFSQKPQLGSSRHIDTSLEFEF
ncbi:peptidase C14 [Coprinopsis marcescibilis]|uniref:Peptidase C14 n=1 Tax=Coprinopsis marcescibilis TaxID=230819 RepID=A0A5C3KU30_COPMA|nr:peptidase C14 [Coprinopsis marcescibilis]